VKARLIPVGDVALVVIQDLDPTLSETARDAEIGTTLVHELGHVLFVQEFEKIQQNPALKKMLWGAYVANVKSKKGDVPSSYTLDRHGFEEWYSDQTAAYVYDFEKKASNAKDSYFKQIARKLRSLFDEVNRLLGGRIELDATFKKYMEGVIDANQSNRAGRPSFAQQLMVREFIADIGKRIPKRAFNSMANTSKGMIKNSSAWRVFNRFALTSDDFLRNAAHGEGGKNIADFFHKMTGTGGDIGFLKAAGNQNRKFLVKFANIFELDSIATEKDFESDRVINAFELVEDEDVTTEQLKSMDTQTAKDALAIRLLLLEMHRYTFDSKTGRIIYPVKFRENYFPRSIDLFEVDSRQAEFVQLLIDHGIPEDDAKATLDTILNNNVDELEVGDGDTRDTRFGEDPLSQAMAKHYRSSKAGNRAAFDEALAAAQSNNDYTFEQFFDELKKQNPKENTINKPLHDLGPNATKAEILEAINAHWDDLTRRQRMSPGMDPALKRTLDGIPTTSLRNAKFIVDPRHALIRYSNALTRKVEFERRGGYAKLTEDMSKIPEEYRRDIEHTVERTLGKITAGTNMRRANSVGLVTTVFTTLLMTVAGSLPDFSGIAVRSKEFNNLKSFMKVTGEAFNGPELRKFAESVGVVHSEAMENAFIGLGEQDYTMAWARTANMYFFRYTGLAMYTRFVRTVAVGMGREFIINTAQKKDFGTREERYLEELGLVRDDVLAWLDTDRDLETETGKKISAGISRFAEESIIRPDSAQRPSWANDPHFQLLFHLKSYYYAFGKTIMGGVFGEAKKRMAEGGGTMDAAMPAVLLAATIFPLTMLGLEMRELFKYMFQLVVPGAEADGYTFRSNYMDNSEYAWEIFNRSGVTGPFAMVITSLDAIEYEGLAAPLTANVPVFDLFDDTFFDGDWKRPIPVLNNIQ